MKAKRLTALLLLVVTLIGMLPGAALAADTPGEALGETDIYNGGEQLAFLSADACGYEQYQYHTDSNHACADDVLYSGAGICLLCHL